MQVTHRKKKQKLESAKKPAVGASLDGISQERNGKWVEKYTEKYWEIKRLN